MERIDVKPTEGRIVIHPVSGKPIKTKGETVFKCPQIKRYLKFGDLELVEKKIKTKTKKEDN
jgi:hypothetical protein